MDGGPCQQSGRLRHHTMLHDRMDQLASSARKRNQRQRRPRRKRQRLRGREYLARHLRELPVYLRRISSGDGKSSSASSLRLVESFLWLIIPTTD